MMEIASTEDKESSHVRENGGRLILVHRGK